MSIECLRELEQEVYLREFHCPFCLSQKTLFKTCNKYPFFYLFCYNCKTKSFIVQNDELKDHIDDNFNIVINIYNKINRAFNISNLTPNKQAICPFCHKNAIVKQCKTTTAKKYRWKCESGCGSGFLFEEALQDWLKICSLF